MFLDAIGDFCCVKKHPELRSKVDEASHAMNAQGDNCEGLTCDVNGKSENTESGL